MKINQVRIGYYAERRKNPKTGEEEVVLHAHEPEVQRRFEILLRDGTKRRSAEKQEKLSEVG